MEILIKLYLSSFLLLLIIFVSIYLIFYKEPLKISESKVEILISTGSLVLILLVLNINILIFPWYIEHHSPLKAYAIICTLSGFCFVNFIYWLKVVRHVIFKKGSSDRKKVPFFLNFNKSSSMTN